MHITIKILQMILLEDHKNYFTDTSDLTKRFRKLNNKKSFGLDKIYLT